jgi:hypothetical protein
LPPGAQPKLISCRDVNTDGRIDRADASPVDVTLVAGQACSDPAHHADFYADPIRMIRDCENSPPFLLVVAIASAGSDLLQPREGESLGLIDILNGLQQRATAANVDMDVIVSTAAIFGADQPQTSMERWITNEVRQRMDANPCLRVALIGHSHGGVTVTTVAAVLDATYGDRILAVAIDRTIALYDRPAEELPARARILNIFQLNEGWHGVPIDVPNVTNVDESDEVAPIAPSDGGGADALVSHKTLDDARAVQSRIIEDVTTFGTAP